MKYFTNTKKHTKYWKNRKIDWKVEYQDNWNHPHRNIISQILSNLQWGSLLEVGCGGGANMINILKHFKNKQIGGIDINEDAVKLLRETFKGSFLKVGSVEDIMMSDKSTDIILSDMCMIYVSNPDKAIKEIKRVARNYVLFSELHSNTLFDKIKLRLSSGYHAHNYKNLLNKHGFKNINIIKMTDEMWSGGNPQKKYGYFILAKVPKK